MCQKRVDASRRGGDHAVLRNLLILLISGSFAGAMMGAEPASPPTGAAAFELEEISSFDAPDVVRSRLLVGAYAECQTEPDSNVRDYPSFRSDKPLYGSLLIGGTPAAPNEGHRYAFAFDESAGSGKGYDRLYLDTNLNGDLTDDAYHSPMKEVSEKALMNPGASNSGISEVCFVPMMLRTGPGDSPQDQLEVMPRLLAYPGSRSFAILTATKVRTGEINIGGERLTAILGHTGSISSRLNHPTTGLYLLPANSSGNRPAASWYGGERLMAMHRKGDTYYRLAASPTGDKLFVWPYQGTFGTLEMKAGARQVQNVRASGSLASNDIAISLTEELGGQTAPPSSSFRLPVGDYAIQMLSVTFDTLNCLVLRNSHADGQPGGRAQNGPPAYVIKIRENMPFVLDLSGKPQVLFASPGKDYHIQRGDQLEVKAVLIDPGLDIMFRSIRQREQLNPKVTIARANGEIVAEGAMPFG